MFVDGLLRGLYHLKKDLVQLIGNNNKISITITK